MPPEDQPAPQPPDELPSYALDDHDEPVGWRRWVRGWRLFGLLLVFALVLAAAFGAKPLYLELKARRALAIAEQAGAAIDRGQGAEASTLLRQAALMAFDDPRVAARVTFHAARAGDMASVDEIGSKIDEGRAAPDEILVFGERSLAVGRTPDARRALDNLPTTLPEAHEIRRIALDAGLAQAEGRRQEARSLLQSALADHPGRAADPLRLLLANLLLTTDEPEGREQAAQLLEQASEGEGEDGAAALRLLAMSRAGLAPNAQTALQETVERLRAHPAATAADEIFIARLLMATDPSRQEETVASLVGRLPPGETPIEERVAAARWLVGLGSYAAVLQLIDDDEPTTHAGALMVTLDALSGLDRWPDASQLIEANRGGTVPDTLYHLLRARIAQEAGDTSTAESQRRLLRQVMQFAELPHVLFAARYAEACGWKPEAFAAWRILAADSGARPDALRGQLRNLPPAVSTQEVLAVAEELLLLQPDDPSTQLSAAYFRLLAGQNVVAAAAVAEEFLAADADSPDTRRVAALGRLRTDQAAAGLEIWPDDGGEPRWQVLHAALLRGAGREKEADQVARMIDERELTPADRELLRTSPPAAP